VDPVREVDLGERVPAEGARRAGLARPIPVASGGSRRSRSSGWMFLAIAVAMLRLTLSAHESLPTRVGHPSHLLDPGDRRDPRPIVGTTEDDIRQWRATLKTPTPSTAGTTVAEHARSAADAGYPSWRAAVERTRTLTLEEAATTLGVDTDDLRRARNAGGAAAVREREHAARRAGHPSWADAIDATIALTVDQAARALGVTASPPTGSGPGDPSSSDPPTPSAATPRRWAPVTCPGTTPSRGRAGFRPPVPPRCRASTRRPSGDGEGHAVTTGPCGASAAPTRPDTLRGPKRSGRPPPARRPSGPGTGRFDPIDPGVACRTRPRARRERARAGRVERAFGRTGKRPARARSDPVPPDANRTGRDRADSLDHGHPARPHTSTNGARLRPVSR
jgi:hypothetical protein